MNMTRKRFIKLLMSRGFSKNTAEYYAKCLNKINIPYKTVFEDEPFINLFWYVLDAVEDPAFNQGR